jgi:hypothetical protein
MRPILQREAPGSPELRKRVQQNLNPFWGLSPDGEVTCAKQTSGYWPERQKNGFALSARSQIGRYAEARS